MFDGSHAGVHDLRGRRGSSGETLGNVDIVNKAQGGSKPSMNAGSCLSNSSIFAIKVRYGRTL